MLEPGHFLHEITSSRFVLSGILLFFSRLSTTEPRVNSHKSSFLKSHFVNKLEAKVIMDNLAVATMLVKTAAMVVPAAHVVRISLRGCSRGGAASISQTRKPNRSLSITYLDGNLVTLSVCVRTLIFSPLVN